MNLNLSSQHRAFGGCVEYYSHNSQSCSSTMRFAIYRPQAATKRNVPVLYWLSGLTCTEETFMVKAGALQHAARHELMLVCPDTSPRVDPPEGNSSVSWDFGPGAGFYLNATQNPWSEHYQMYSYIVQELPQLIVQNFPVLKDRQGIFGHSMGGHGALIALLRNPEKYVSGSAFAPIAAPCQSPWGKKAFGGYLGENPSEWESYDASLLLERTQARIPILVDQGLSDKFLTEQLMPDQLERAAARVNYPLTLRRHEGYDHSYYFIQSFIKDHLDHHAYALNR